MDKKTQQYLAVGAIALVVVMAALFLLYYSGCDNAPVSNATNGTTPNTPNTPNPADPTTSDTGEGLSSNADTIYATPGGTGSAIPPTKIYTVEDLYNVRNNLAGNYIVMNDLFFFDPGCYDFSNQDAWDFADENLNDYAEYLVEGGQFPNIGEAKAWILEIDPNFRKSAYMRYFSISWTPIGTLDTSKLDDSILDDRNALIAAVFKNAFTGSFNGNGKTIIFSGGGRGVSVSQSEDVSLYDVRRSSGGLFAVIGKTGSVSNVNLAGPSASGGFLGNGNIAGINLGTISSCSVSSYGWFESAPAPVIVKAKKMASFAAGGLVGINAGTIRDSSFSGSVSGDSGIGGIAGININVSDVELVIDNSFISEVIPEEGPLFFLISKGYLTGPATIQNCSVEDSEFYGDSVVGGIAGLNLVGMIKQSSIFETDVYGESDVGGIAGNSVYSQIQNCSVNYGYISGDYDIGGIAGFSVGEIIQCSVSETNVYGYGDVGGIVGYSISGMVQDCYTKNLEISGSNEVGGIAGGVENASITNCYFSGKLDGSEMAGGIAGSVSGEESVVKNNVVVGPYIPWENDDVNGVIGIASEEFASTYSIDENYVYDGIEWDGNIIDPETCDGKLITIHELYQQDTYASAAEDWTSWDFGFVWKMDGGPYGLPIFKWQDSSISELWMIETININAGSLSLTEDDITSRIRIDPSGHLRIELNGDDLPGGNIIFGGTWVYDTTSKQGDFVFEIWPPYNNMVKAQLDDNGNLVVDNMIFDYYYGPGSFVTVSATNIKLKDVPPIPLWEIYKLDATAGEMPYSENDLQYPDLRIGLNDGTYDFCVTDPSFSSGGTWESDTTTRLLGDFIFTFDEIEDEKYGARIVYLGRSYYLIVDVENEDFNFTVDTIPVDVRELIFRGIDIT
ncbi:GLUG motif-containing protein [Methanolapillus africanus]